MRSALCLGVTVGIAFAGAGLTVVTPAAVSPTDLRVAAVDLTAGPIDPYIDLLTNSLTNLEAIATRWLDDPLPAVQQLAVNWFGYAQLTIDSFVATGQSFVDGVANLPDQLQTLVDALTTGDFLTVAAMAIIIVISIDPVLGLVDRLLEIPYDIIGNAVSAFMAALHAAQVPIGLAAIHAVQATGVEIGLVVHDFVDDIHAGDLAGAVAQLVEAPAQVLNATLNSETLGLPGLLTVFQDLSQAGFVDAVLNFLPRAVAEAISAADFDGSDAGAVLPPLAETATSLFDVAP